MTMVYHGLSWSLSGTIAFHGQQHFFNMEFSIEKKPPFRSISWSKNIKCNETMVTSIMVYHCIWWYLTMKCCQMQWFFTMKCCQMQWFLTMKCCQIQWFRPWNAVKCSGFDNEMPSNAMLYHDAFDHGFIAFDVFDHEILRNGVFFQWKTPC